MYEVTSFSCSRDVVAQLVIGEKIVRLKPKHDPGVNFGSPVGTSMPKKESISIFQVKH